MFTDKIKKQTQDNNILVNAYDASGLPCHFYIKCKDYMLAKMLKEANRFGCTPQNFGDVTNTGYGHL